MFSKLKCVFPVATSPFQKISCTAVGIFITTGGIYSSINGINKYVDYNTNNKTVSTVPDKKVSVFNEQKVDNSHFESFALKPTEVVLTAVYSPLIATYNPYLFVVSLPFLGLYSYLQYNLSKLWYCSIKQGIINVRNTDQCCKLIRMSMAGTIKHSFFTLCFVSYTYAVGYGFYITGQNGYNIATGNR
jgi:hypothetical protein